MHATYILFSQNGFCTDMPGCQEENELAPFLVTCYFSVHLSYRNLAWRLRASGQLSFLLFRLMITTPVNTSDEPMICSAEIPSPKNT